jgi:hypothetical protein
MRGVGMANSITCVVPYGDAGKPCSDSSECEGRCLQKPPLMDDGAKTLGACEVNSDHFGCNSEVLGGIAQGTLCTD